MFNVGPPQLAARFKEAQKDWRASRLRKEFGAFKRVGVTASHTTPHTQWTIDEIYCKDANNTTFPDPDDRSDTPDKKKKQISIAQYFKKKYNINVTPGIPVVKMTKKIRGSHVFMPMDVLRIDANQRYNTKLSDTQTSNMIKFAVTLPKERWAAVQQGVRLLNWANDPYLKHYGLQISPKYVFPPISAELLTSPVLLRSTLVSCLLRPSNLALAPRKQLSSHRT